MQSQPISHSRARSPPFHMLTDTHSSPLNMQHRKDTSHSTTSQYHSTRSITTHIAQYHAHHAHQSAPLAHSCNARSASHAVLTIRHTAQSHVRQSVTQSQPNSHSRARSPPTHTLTDTCSQPLACIPATQSRFAYLN